MIVNLDLSSLEAAIQRLAEALTALTEEPENAFIRDAVIKRFEFTYELSHKMLRRFLEMSAANPEVVEQMSFQDLIRTGSEQDLLRSDWERWHVWRQTRGITSHTYNQEKARQVATAVPEFLLEARHLFTQLQRRTSSP